MIGSHFRRASADRPDPDSDRAAQARTLETIFRTRYRELCAVAYRFVRSRAEAEEVVQDACLAVWHRRESWGDVAELHRYLFAVTRNRAISRLRHAKVERNSQGFFQVNDPTGIGERTVAADWDTETNELWARAQQVIDALPERCRYTLTLRLERHLRNAEIAEVMGVTVKAVERNLTRAFEALRVALDLPRADR